MVACLMGRRWWTYSLPCNMFTCLPCDSYLRAVQDSVVVSLVVRVTSVRHY